MKRKLTLTVILIAFIMMSCKERSDFPITDLHVHLKGKLTIEDAAKKSKDENI
jgi:hypothetical protein